MLLDDLLAPTSRAAFLADHFLKLPFAKAGGCKHLTHLADWPALVRFLADPDVDVLAGRQGEQWPGPRPTTADAARALLADGYTLRVRHAERHDPALADLAADFARAFAAPVDVHVYCTPAGHAGFGWHYDAEDVFILQTAGAKDWWLRKNTVNPWPLMDALPDDMGYRREIMPAMRCELRAGDWLYIPAGYWHRTQAGEESISLSVGVKSLTAVDVYDFLRREVVESLQWRQRLPPPGAVADAADLGRRYGELFAELGRDLAARLSRPETAAAFLAAVRNDNK